jgi:hypothetical protein
MALSELSVGTAVIFVDVRADAMSELRFQPLPGVLLARNVLPIFPPVGQVETP